MSAVVVIFGIDETDAHKSHEKSKKLSRLGICGMMKGRMVYKSDGIARDG